MSLGSQRGMVTLPQTCTSTNKKTTLLTLQSYLICIYVLCRWIGLHLHSLSCVWNNGFPLIWLHQLGKLHTSYLSCWLRMWKINNMLTLVFQRMIYTSMVTKEKNMWCWCPPGEINCQIHLKISSMIFLGINYHLVKKKLNALALKFEVLNF